jgi:hypothetical protein
MKTFRVIGWFRSNGEKDFEQEIYTTEKVKYAVQLFLATHPEINFYKIEIKQTS